MCVCVCVCVCGRACTTCCTRTRRTTSHACIAYTRSTATTTSNPSPTCLETLCDRYTYTTYYICTYRQWHTYTMCSMFLRVFAVGCVNMQVGSDLVEKAKASNAAPAAAAEGEKAEAAPGSSKDEVKVTMHVHCLHRYSYHAHTNVNNAAAAVCMHIGGRTCGCGRGSRQRSLAGARPDRSASALQRHRQRLLRQEPDHAEGAQTSVRRLHQQGQSYTTLTPHYTYHIPALTDAHTHARAHTYSHILDPAWYL